LSINEEHDDDDDDDDGAHNILSADVTFRASGRRPEHHAGSPAEWSKPPSPGVVAPRAVDVPERHLDRAAFRRRSVAAGRYRWDGPPAGLSLPAGEQLKGVFLDGYDN